MGRPHRAERDATLHDRPSCAHRIPHRTPTETETLIIELRRASKLRPARIVPLLNMPASNVDAVLARLGLSRLTSVDRPTAAVIRRYERDRPGELVHVDVKKLGRLRHGGGWRVHGRNSLVHRRVRSGPRIGFDYVHAATDDHTRIAYAEAYPDERPTPAPDSSPAPSQHSPSTGSTYSRGMTDNAIAYRRSAAWRDALAELSASARFTRRYRPEPTARPNSAAGHARAMRLARSFTSSTDRTQALPG